MYARMLTTSSLKIEPVYRKEMVGMAAYEVDESLNQKIVLFKGDITKLKIAAIVNAANNGLHRGGGICGAIFAAAGPDLIAECKQLGNCDTGNTVISKAYNLPCEHILHSVGPTKRESPLLQSCYRTILDRAKHNNIRSVAFCCLSTGIYGFPGREACKLVLSCVREYLDKLKNEADSTSFDLTSNAAKAVNPFDLLVFACFRDEDELLYRQYLPHFFPSAYVETHYSDADVPASYIAPPPPPPPKSDGDTTNDQLLAQMLQQQMDEEERAATRRSGGGRGGGRGRRGGFGGGWDGGGGSIM